MKDIIEHSRIRRNRWWIGFFNHDTFKCEQQTKAYFHKQRTSEICMRSEIYSLKPAFCQKRIRKSEALC